MIGQTVGNFEIVSPLGKGGMGEVWLVQQKSLKTKAAIKILGAAITQDPTQRERFRREAMAVSQIPHAGIVKIFDDGVLPDGRLYLIMEYLEGETLGARIKRMGRLDLSLLADFGRQIASVLDATHGAGITHRDLKPDNIFLVRDAEMPHGERVKVLDFGIAKLDTVTGPRMTAMSTSSIGTPNYMSPEQWHSLAEVGWQTDAYALGCIAMEMATGKPPFVAESRVEVCSMHLGEIPPAPSERVPGLPVQLDQLVAALLEKEPEKRPTMRAAVAIFTGLGQTAGIALSTLPPTMISPFVAGASGSMQYKDTPRAMPIRTGTEPGVNMPLPSRDAGDSMPFKPTPVQGMASQHDMRAITDASADQRASQPMYGSKAMPVVKKRTGLYVVLALLVIGGIVFAVVMGTRGGSSEQGSGSGSGSGSATVAVGSGSAKDLGSAKEPGSGSAKESGSGSAKELGTAVGSGSAETGSAAPPPRKRRLATAPPRKSTTNIPVLDAPLELEVCIDTEGNVDWVERLDLKPLDKDVRAKVLTWDYPPFVDEGKATPVCFNVVIPKQDKAKPVAAPQLPAQLTQRMQNDAIAAALDTLNCDASGSLRVTLQVAPKGNVTSVTVAGTTSRSLVDCLRRTFLEAKFPATQRGGTVVFPMSFGG